MAPRHSVNDTQQKGLTSTFGIIDTQNNYHILLSTVRTFFIEKWYWNVVCSLCLEISIHQPYSYTKYSGKIVKWRCAVYSYTYYFWWNMVTLSITTLCHNVECHNAECGILFVVVLKVIMLSVVMLYVVMLNVLMLNVIMLNVIMLNVIMLNVVVLKVAAPKNNNFKT